MASSIFQGDRIEGFVDTGLPPPSETVIFGPESSPSLPTQQDLRPFLSVPIFGGPQQTFVPTTLPFSQAPGAPHLENFNAIADEQNRLQSILDRIPVVGPVVEKGIDVAVEVFDFVKGALTGFFGGDEDISAKGMTEIAPTPIPGGVGAQFDREGAIAGVPAVGGLVRILPGVVALAAASRFSTSRIIRMIVAALGIMTIEEAADHFGLSISEIARAWIYGKTRRRRRSRGISAADLRRTRSTLSKVSRINCLIKKGSRSTRCC